MSGQWVWRCGQWGQQQRDHGEVHALYRIRTLKCLCQNQRSCHCCELPPCLLIKHDRASGKATDPLIIRQHLECRCEYGHCLIARITANHQRCSRSANPVVDVSGLVGATGQDQFGLVGGSVA